jgi:hypothetical protein
MIRVGLYFLLACFSSRAIAEDQYLTLDVKFLGADRIKFSQYATVGGDGVRGELSVQGGGLVELPGRCEPEGGDPDVLTAFSVKEREESILVYVCRWRVDHSGLGIKGTDYRGYVYGEDGAGGVKEKKYLEKDLGGYEGSNEGGGRGYFYYSNVDILKQKVKELVTGRGIDSLAIAHAVILERLADLDSDGIENYLSNERLETLLKNEPLRAANVGYYNDLGYALGQIGAFSASYDLLKRVEEVTPNRLVLKLNIADALWGMNDKVGARKYYSAYISGMKAAGKEKKIPGEILGRGL